MKVIPVRIWPGMERRAEVGAASPEWLLRAQRRAAPVRLQGPTLKKLALKICGSWLKTRPPWGAGRFYRPDRRNRAAMHVDGSSSMTTSLAVELGYDTTQRLSQRNTRVTPSDYNNREWMTWPPRRLTGCCGNCAVG